MTEQELIARCRVHEISYTSLPSEARRELLYLTAEADRHGGTVLIRCAEQLREECAVNAHACDALYGAMTEITQSVIADVNACLEALGDTGRTISFSVSNTRPSAAALQSWHRLQESVQTQERALGLLRGACYRQLSEAAMTERSCLRCRIMGQLLSDAAVLCELDDPTLNTALRELTDVQKHCHERRRAQRDELEEALALCETTLPQILIDFRGIAVRDEREWSTLLLIRACEQLRMKLSSLQSLLFSKKHA